MTAATSFGLPRFSLLALASALALGAAPFAQAQSLQEVYDTARGYDATYLAAKALAESAQYRAEQVHALRRPNAFATLGASRSTSEVPSSDTTTKGSSASVTATQSLFNRANDATITQADIAVDVSRADLEVAEQDLIVRVSQAYFDVLAAQDSLSAAQANRKAISEQLASAKRNFEVGTTTITDTREAQARFDLATAQELVADNDLRTKRIALDQIVGRQNVEPKPLATAAMLPAAPTTSIDDWVAQSEDSPAVRRAKLAYDVAQLETTKARAGHLPTVGLSASYSKGHTNVDGSQLASSGALAGQMVPFNSSGATNSSSVGISMNIPLFAGFSVQNRVKETLLLEEQARNNLETARRAVAQNTRSAYLGAQSLQAQVKALEAAESSTQLALDATQLGYKVGVRVNLDVLNAQTQLYTARSNLAKARYDVLMNVLKLRQASGQLRPSDVSTVNQALTK